MPETPEQELARLRNAVRELPNFLRLEIPDILMDEHGSQCDCDVCRTFGYAAEQAEDEE